MLSQNTKIMGLKRQKRGISELLICFSPSSGLDPLRENRHSHSFYVHQFCRLSIVV